MNKPALAVRVVVASAIAMLGIILAPSSHADVIDFNFDALFSASGTPVSTNTPWVRAEFTDISPGTVQLTFTSLSLSNNENVDELYLNLDPSLNPNSLVFSNTASSGSFTLPTIATGVNSFKADGDGKYDIHFAFDNSGTSPTLFDDTDSVTYKITGIGSLVASNFVFLSAPAGGNGPFYGALHFQRLGTSATQSAWSDSSVTVVPEPGAISLMILPGLLYLGHRVSRRRTHSSAT